MCLMGAFLQFSILQILTEDRMMEHFIKLWEFLMTRSWVSKAVRCPHKSMVSCDSKPHHATECHPCKRCTERLDMTRAYRLYRILRHRAVVLWNSLSGSKARSSKTRPDTLCLALFPCSPSKTNRFHSAAACRSYFCIPESRTRVLTSKCTAIRALPLFAWPIRTLLLFQWILCPCNTRDKYCDLLTSLLFDWSPRGEHWLRSRDRWTVAFEDLKR